MRIFLKPIEEFNRLSQRIWARGSLVVKALGYKSERHWLEAR
jgi:hypothetical protein